MGTQHLADERGIEFAQSKVDRGPAKDTAGYYLQASESGGEPPGRWRGPGAKALGLEPGQIVEREPYDLPFGQRKARDDTPLGRPPGSGRKTAEHYARLLAAKPHATAERQHELRIASARQARQSPLFFDLTISLSKSISMTSVLVQPETFRRIRFPSASKPSKTTPAPAASTRPVIRAGLAVTAVVEVDAVFAEAAARSLSPELKPATWLPTGSRAGPHCQ